MSDWQISGTYVEACNCEAACPCIFFSPPTEGECKVILGWRIESGDYRGVDVAGLNTAMLAYAPGNMKDGNWKVALYLDQRASEAQAEGLQGIFSGAAGGHLASLGPLIGEVMGARAADIRFEGGGKRFSLSVDGAASVEIEAIAGQGGGAVDITGHPLAIAPGQPATVARSTSLSIDDHGVHCEIDGRSGLFAPFQYQG